MTLSSIIKRNTFRFISTSLIGILAGISIGYMEKTGYIFDSEVRLTTLAASSGILTGLEDYLDINYNETRVREAINDDIGTFSGYIAGYLLGSYYMS